MSENKKIYILHGWVYSTEKWKPFLVELKEKGFDPVVLKIPGLTAPLNKVWTLENYVEWFNKEIDSKKDLILLGHSNGGRICLAFAAKYPEKVAKLILIDSAGIYHNELPIRIKRLVFGTAAKLGKKFSNAKVFQKLLYKFAKEHDYEKADPIVKKTMVNLIKIDLRDRLKNLEAKTLIIWGSIDRITPVEDGVLMKEKIKNSIIEIVDGAKHSPMFTHSEVVAEIIYKNL